MSVPTPFRRVVPSDLKASDWHAFMVGAVAPRPVAFVSTRMPKAA
ncbi:hypothetical protein [Hymenobacter sp. AT01-02]|nr:hypothetical protein [Hymenobacter sp. AT01-02]